LIHAKLGNETEAVELLEQYLLAEPKGERAVSALMELTRFHRDGKDLAKIRSLLHAAVSANPEDATAWEALADAHLQIGEEIRAEHCWRRALQVDPDRLRPLVSLGEAYLRRGDHRHATPLLNRAYQQDLSDTRVVGLLVDSLTAGDELERADELATTWVEEHPESLGAWLKLAAVRRKRKDHPAANHCIEKARAVAESPTERAEVALADFANRQPLEFAELQRVVRLTTPGPDQARALAWKFSTGVYAREQVPLLWKETARLHAIAGDFRPAAECLTLAHQALQDDSVSALRQLADWQIRGGLLEAADRTIGRLRETGAAEVESLIKSLEAARQPSPPPPSPTTEAPAVQPPPESEQAEPASNWLGRAWAALRKFLPK
jgi:tetratricopeptide (TPR) repeat protein